MSRILILLCLFLVSAVSTAETHGGLYQVDMIVFLNNYAAQDQLEALSPNIPFVVSASAIPLRTLESGARSTYQLLPITSSTLQSDWRRLGQVNEYHRLLHYTWLQPNNNQHPVQISSESSDSWHIEGALRVRQSNYYLLDVQLHFASQHYGKAFLLKQSLRLKPGVTYYLDHPQAGVLIRVHKV